MASVKKRKVVSDTCWGGVLKERKYNVYEYWSDWEFNGLVVLVANHKIVYEVSIEQTLEDSCEEGCQNNPIPMEDPKYLFPYQWKMYIIL